MPKDDETANILKSLPGGAELLEWFGGAPNFGDGEVMSLSLDRKGPSVLRVLTIKRGANGDWEHAIVSFHLTEMIDVSIEGFSHQNVIDGLKLRHSSEGDVHPSLLGIGGNAPGV